MNTMLLLAATLNALAALLHVGCIVFGGPWYRFFGAGEHMAQMAESGSLRPTLITTGIVVVLFSWSAYAASAAGLIAKLPLLKLALITITGVCLLRGLVGFAFVASPAMGNSAVFWFWSSLICTALGLVHLTGTIQRWSVL